MAELILRLGNRLLFSKRKKCVRNGLVHFSINALLVGAFIFAVETVIILLGLGDIFIPLKKETLSFLATLF